MRLKSIKRKEMKGNRNEDQEVNCAQSTNQSRVSLLSQFKNSQYWQNSVPGLTQVDAVYWSPFSSRCFFSDVKEGRWDETAFGVKQGRSHGEQRVSPNTEWSIRLAVRLSIVSRQTPFHLTSLPLYSVSIFRTFFEFSSSFFPWITPGFSGSMKMASTAAAAAGDAPAAVSDPKKQVRLESGGELFLTFTFSGVVPCCIEQIYWRISWLVFFVFFSPDHQVFSVDIEAAKKSKVIKEMLENLTGEDDTSSRDWWGMFSFSTSKNSARFFLWFVGISCRRLTKQGDTYAWQSLKIAVGTRLIWLLGFSIRFDCLLDWLIDSMKFLGQNRWIVWLIDWNWLTIVLLVLFTGAWLIHSRCPTSAGRFSRRLSRGWSTMWRWMSQNCRRTICPISRMKSRSGTRSLSRSTQALSLSWLSRPTTWTSRKCGPFAARLLRRSWNVSAWKKYERSITSRTILHRRKRNRSVARTSGMHFFEFSSEVDRSID